MSVAATHLVGVMDARGRCDLPGRRGRDKPIAAARDRLDKPRLPRLVAERKADLSNAVIEAVLEVHSRVIAPQRGDHLLARHQFAGPGHQERQQRRRLRFEPMHRAATADLPGSCVELEIGAANEHVAMDGLATRTVPGAGSKRRA